VRSDQRTRVQTDIIRGISDGETKLSVCRALGINPRTVTRWIDRDPVFAERYRRARVEQAHALADRAIEIANEPTTDMAAVQRNRLRVDTIKWFCSEIAPKLYGDRVYHDTNVSGGVVVLPGFTSSAPSSNDESLPRRSGFKVLTTPHSHVEGRE
jgi:hypothetical protein